MISSNREKYMICWPPYNIYLTVGIESEGDFLSEMNGNYKDACWVDSINSYNEVISKIIPRILKNKVTLAELYESKTSYCSLSFEDYERILKEIKALREMPSLRLL